MKLSPLLGEAWKKTNGFKSVIWKAVFYYGLVTLGFFLVSIPVKLVGQFLGASGLFDWLLSVAQMLLFPPLVVGLAVLSLRRALAEPVSAGTIFSFYKNPVMLRAVSLVIINTFIFTVVMFVLGFLMSPLFHFSAVSVSPAAGWQAWLSAKMNSMSFLPPKDLLKFKNLLSAIFALIMLLFLIVAYYAFSFSCMLIGQQQIGVMAALKYTYNGSLDHFGLLIRFSLVKLFFNVIGLFTLGILWIWTGPWLQLAQGVVCRAIFFTEQKKG